MNPLIKTILSTNAGAGLAILRIVTGLTLMSTVRKSSSACSAAPA